MNFCFYSTYENESLLYEKRKDLDILLDVTGLFVNLYYHLLNRLSLSKEKHFDFFFLNFVRIF